MNHDPRILTASDGHENDYVTGIEAGIAGMDTGGPRLMVYRFQGRWAQNVRIGCFSPLDQTFFTGLIGEVLVYDRDLTAAEEDAASAYLIRKWKLNVE